MPQIRIDSILGGQSPTTHFGSKGQFRASLGIDPAQPLDDLDTAYSTFASGLLRPTPVQKYSGTTINAAPLWQEPNPKDGNVYVLDALGSMYTVDATFSTVTALSDGGSLSNGKGNGLAYYDNYIYAALNTTIARYGPLNGAAAFAGNYWVSGASMTALADTTYPTDYKAGVEYPNHVLHRHSDGRLYVADVVGNQGAIHYVKTSKTTVEGDTDSSAYLALTLGYGLWPTDLESFGTDLVIALFEGSAANLRQTRAKLAFWDTTSTNVDKIIFVEYPDQIITALKNVNGALYVVSGNYNSRGYRVTRFLGGYSFEELAYVETGEPCFPGAIDGQLMRVLIGTFSTAPESDGSVYSIGLQKASLGKGLFNVMRSTGGNSSTVVTSVCVADNNELGFLVPSIGWTKGSGTSNNGLDKQGSTYGNVANVWWSELFRIGSPFEIQKISLPLAQAVAANMTLNVTIYIDDGNGSFTGTSYGLPTINNTNFPSGDKIVDLLVKNVRGEHNFWVELRWTGTALLTVGFPILIDFEPIPN